MKTSESASELSIYSSPSSARLLLPVEFTALKEVTKFRTKLRGIFLKELDSVRMETRSHMTSYLGLEGLIAGMLPF